jgi:4-alpha-glucanotransferase
MASKMRSRLPRTAVPRALLAEAARLGIETDFVDGRGHARSADAETIRGLIDMLSRSSTLQAAPAAQAVPVRPGFSGLFDRAWGISVQLYGLRSARNWGHGDFSDLRGLIELAAEHGAAAVGLNPLHALFDDAAERASPYSPNTRLFLNVLYVDVESVPGFPGLEAAGLVDAIAQLRSRDLVDYAGVAAAKQQGLRLAFERFRSSAAEREQEEFERFRQEQGARLLRFAAFEYLRRHHAGPWWQWPAEWRKPDDSELANLRARDNAAIAFFEFQQWAAHRQLEACVHLARRLDMPVGLYLDAAVGVDPAGFDAWNDQGAILRELSIGAPPDPFNPAGQNWGLAGFNGAGLAECEFAPFRAMVQHSMRYAGAIRLDHVLGLKRLYVIPGGLPPDKGLYLRMPLEHLLAIVAEESNANRCIVIGEDLGTVPEGLREMLAAWGIWRYHVLIFERAAGGGFLAPQAFARNALVTNATHDLPTFAAWISGADLRLRQGLGLDPGESEADRQSALRALAAALAEEGLSPLAFDAVVQFMNATPSRLLMISVEDVLDLTDQPNLPGTVHEHPNWRRRLPIELDALAKHQRLASIAELLRAGGRASPTRQIAGEHQ